VQDQALSRPKAAVFLEQTLLLNVVIHVVAMLTMALILFNGLPGGPVKDDADRVAFIAEHPWLWRLGWLPWHLCAAIDLVTGIALVCTRWVPRLAAVFTLLVTICAVVPEQIGEIGWVTRGVGLAQEANATGQLADYLAYEGQSMYLATEVGASLYIVMALGWTWCFVAAGTWNRTLTILTPLTWGALAVTSIGLLLKRFAAPALGPILTDDVVGALNGLGFTLLAVWLVLVTEQVLRRSRPDNWHGRLLPWRHPWNNFVGRILDVIANSRFVRALCEWPPVPGFRSDIGSVIYVNYLVDADRLQALVPEGMELQRLGQGGRWALFSSLTYRHGHFGPGFLGPLRKLLPSPVQTNWRIYVRDPRTGRTGIYFVTNAIASTVHALGARLASEGMPMHALKGGGVEVNAGQVKAWIDPGSGSGPDLTAELVPAPPSLPEPFDKVWGSYDDFLAYSVTQDRAFTGQPWYGRITRQEIELRGVSLADVEPLAGEARSEAAKKYVGEAKAVCFRVPRVDFWFTGEHHERLPG
jgi:hypothetical protein